MYELCIYIYPHVISYNVYYVTLIMAKERYNYIKNYFMLCRQRTMEREANHGTNTQLNMI